METISASEIEAAAQVAANALRKSFFLSFPNEAAGFLSSLSTSEILGLLKPETVGTAAHLLECMNPEAAAKAIDEMDEDYFRQVVPLVDPRQAASLLLRLDKDSVERRLSTLPASTVRELRELMTYPAGSAGSMMDPRVTVFRRDDTVEDALTQIRARTERRVLDISLVDEEMRLEALVPLQEIAVAKPTDRLGDLVKARPMSIQATSPREEVVRLLEEGRLASLPVVDFDGRLLGIIRYDTLVSAAKQEASEDLQTMFGAGKEERALSKVSLAIRKRLPWLEINLGTAFLAAAVVGLFEDTIAKITALAVFLPVVAGQSGNTGSQALAVTMRGLALREIRTRHWLRVARKEIMVGFLNGVAIALTTSIVVQIWMGSLGLALVIGIAMVLSMVIAGMSGAVIPVILKAMGQDPAQSSSIVLTTVTDVFGFMSFLGLAKVLSNTLGIA
jgi:magnesium transporter